MNDSKNLDGLAAEFIERQVFANNQHSVARFLEPGVPGHMPYQRVKGEFSDCVVEFFDKGNSPIGILFSDPIMNQ